ncbi:MAG: preprotein translocase subunit SecE [Tissierellia bacterium]|nr:preprotein translocase subunit SecE [Tissierellia bacterium]
MANAKSTGNEVDRKSIGKYFRGVRSEYKKVVWPTKEQLLNYSGIVVLVSVLTAVAIYALDFVISRIIGFIIGL